MNLLKSRKFRQGTLATVITVVVVAAIVIFNLLTTALTDRYGLSLDLTENKIYSLSDETKDFLRTMDKDVAIYALSPEENMSSYATEMLRLFAQAGPRVTVRYVDLLKDPTFVNAYPTDLELNAGTILVVCDGNYSTFTSNDFFNTSIDYSTGGYVTSSQAEQTISSAILNVVSDKQVKVTVLTGHGEVDASLLTASLEKNNYEIVTQNLLTEDEVDPEAVIAVIASPARDLDRDELQKLDRFLENDGRYGKTLLYMPSVTQPELPEMEAFLSEWGIGLGRGLVAEFSQGKAYGNVYIPVVEYVESDYSASLQSQNLLVVVPYARPMSILFEAKGGVQTTALLQFSETAIVIPEDADENWTPTEEDLGQQPPALAMGQITRYDGTTPMVSTVLVTASSDMLTNGVVMAGNIGNTGYALNLLNNLAGREEVLTVKDKPLDTTNIAISIQQVVTLVWLFAILLPLAVFVFGIVVWMRRRHK